MLGSRATRDNLRDHVETNDFLYYLIDLHIYILPPLGGPRYVKAQTPYPSLQTIKYMNTCKKKKKYEH